MGCQVSSVIVDHHREQARSYRGSLVVGIRPRTKELENSTLRAIVVRALATKNLHQTGKYSRV